MSEETLEAQSPDGDVREAEYLATLNLLRKAALEYLDRSVPAQGMRQYAIALAEAISSASPAAIETRIARR